MIVTVAVDVPPRPSLMEYVKLSALALVPELGVYVR